MKKVFYSGWWLVLTVVLSVSLAACAPATPAVQQVTIQASEFKYDLTQITVKAGQPVRLVFKNAGTIDHELEVDGLNPKDYTVDQSQAGAIPEAERTETSEDVQKAIVHVYAAPNGTAIALFTPQQTGTFEFSCGISGHKDAGMVGKLIVQ